uniref:Uncharacterized protein n=1 Tax=Haptolina ericina TaxID=156174 RepID=A0A7S3AWX0_9EUKA|mmetsp:Transcript_40305/g.91261  ORF Transcript_40305/g.91261 Transcript_40305/m.91261 type:complete len:225 (+) Transcript_40305:72-746(+)|eukprot:CAMPEP_0181203218 /NCGR_PEP_ID=MMETSP1096-20121128/19264_1 /TAXON_ID=156174 ORGANISM="Chrysochromulina ericina, Strain CCMP281" /NCGR_SAMPLE_ID=MMETSP1096 /ASSEMBLY_ACC=CAM_ASM_000453 /LENGTH=224 /DNA_ID=CAMNT_0023293795 /DNA_START=72 /DNA_END=746 /DNA_ORIENTATION=-
MTVMAVQVPLNVFPGMQFRVMTPYGQQLDVVCPHMAGPGQMIHIRVPAQQFVPQAPPAQQIMRADSAKPKVAAQEVKEDEIPADAVVTPAFMKTSMPEATQEEHLCPCLSCICISCNIYATFPDCVGAYVKGVCCCCECEELCCKLSRTDGSLCKCMHGEVEIIVPVTCIKSVQTCCCIDARIAIPFDEEVPCELGLMGFICVKNFECVCQVYETHAKQSEVKA